MPISRRRASVGGRAIINQAKSSSGRTATGGVDEVVAEVSSRFENFLYVSSVMNERTRRIFMDVY